MITLLDASVDDVLAACGRLSDGTGAPAVASGAVAETSVRSHAPSRADTGLGGPGRQTVRETEAAERLVDAADREAAGRRQRPADARRTLAGRAALRLLVSARLGVPAALASQVVVDRSCRSCHRPHGRPQVAGLSVSTSSAEDRVLVAVADTGAEVGVDIEHVPETVFDGFDTFVLHPDERELFGPATNGSSATAERLGCWVEKEAVLKAVGVGLGSPPHQVLVSPRSRDAVPLPRADLIGPWEWRPVLEAGVAEAVGLSVTELPAPAGYRCAIAARKPARLRVVDLELLVSGT